MQTRPPRRRRARPVADAPIDELLPRTEALAKGWLLALLEGVPLEDAAAVLASSIAADGPRICAAILRALSDDRDLGRLELGGVLEPLVSSCGDFGGGPGSADRALVAVDALHGVLWSALRGELRDPEPEQIYELSERLAAATELVRAAAVRRLSGQAPTASPHAFQPEPPPAPAPPPEPPPPSGVPDPAAPAATELGPLRPVPEPPPPVASARAGGDEALWVAALEEEVMRSRRSGAPLSLLLVELAESERLLAAGAGGDVTAAFGRFAQAVRSVLRRQDLLASEADARAWVIARDTARAGAAALGQRIAEAVQAADSLSGAPLTVTIGVAVLGEDAHDTDSMLEAAEESAFAAAASGSPMGANDPPDAS